jgi:hypothetical protein
MALDAVLSQPIPGATDTTLIQPAWRASKKPAQPRPEVRVPLATRCQLRESRVKRVRDAGISVGKSISERRRGRRTLHVKPGRDTSLTQEARVQETLITERVKSRDLDVSGRQIFVGRKQRRHV